MINISVVTPVYNTKAEYLQECFDSIWNQTYKPIESIFVNDGSTREETLKFLDSIRNKENVIVIDQENKKTAAALNAGIRIMKGNWWAGLASDDIWKPYKLQLQTTLINRNAEAKIIHGDFELIDANKKVLSIHRDPVFPDLRQQQKFLIASYFGMWSNLLIEKEVIDDVGMFNEEVLGVEDYDFAIRLSTKYRYYKVPEILTSYRTHPEQNTHTDYGYQGKIGRQYDLKCHQLAQKLFG